MKNQFFELLDLDECKRLIEYAKAEKEIAFLCPFYSINIQSKYYHTENIDPEQMNWDFEAFEKALGCSLSVNDYDDLIADFSETDD